MPIHQVLVGASPGDAVTESAIMISRALSTRVDSKVYAFHRDERLTGSVELLRDFPSGEGDGVIVFHVSIGAPAVVDFVCRRPERLVLVYHNITPAAFFDELDPGFARLLRSGRRSLHPLIASAEGAIADSEFNAAELRRLGMQNVVVSPPALNIDRLLATSPDEGLRAQLQSISAPVVLLVSQLLPHKRPDLAIDAIHLFNINHDADARLVVVGPWRNPQYAAAIVGHVRSLNLPTVWLTGEVTDAQLAAFYERADVMIAASEHEGFAVPIAEAFAFGVPVVVRDFGAMAETGGDAALVLSPSTTAAGLCEAVRRVLTDEPLRRVMIARGRERAKRFTTAATTAASLRALQSVLSQAKPART